MASLAVAGNLVRKPTFLGERNVKLVDASDETTKGKNKNTWRLHYVFNLFAFECSSMELTTSKEGENLPRHFFHDFIISYFLGLRKWVLL